MRYAVIMAGGAGVRLWPLSRQARPKQVLRILDGKSLVRESYERIASLFEPKQIYVITNQAHLPLIAREIPELPADNLIGEPAVRDTANAVGLTAAILARHDPDAVIGVFTADHVISPLDRFRAAVSKACDAAERHPDALITMGIKPTRPETGYGYVRRGAPLGEGLFQVASFTEKPSLDKAKDYVVGGEHYWNSGMFVWRASTILGELKKHLPASYTALSAIADAWQTPQRREKLESAYPGLTKISIDFAVMERAERVLVVEMDCRWVDVGSWSAVESVMDRDCNGNVSTGRDVVHLGSRGCTMVSEEKHLIAALGVEDLIIVHSPDATLVCRKSDISAMKELVDMVRAQYGDRYA